MTSGIYMIRHKESGTKYIGRSVDIEMRWHQHKSDAKHKRTNNPVHNAIRKYGHEAFEWKILVTAPAVLQPVLEAQFIIDWGTMKPNGYNLGGAEGGFPSREIVATMVPEEQIRWKAVMSRAAKAGHEALKELRTDPEYEAEYLKIKSAASTKREARIRARRENDPEYDAKMKASRTAAAKKNPKRNDEKASATFHERMRDDPEFAKQVRTNRSKAGKLMNENARAKTLETAERLAKEMGVAFVLRH